MNLFSPDVQASIYLKLDEKFKIKARKHIRVFNDKYKEQREMMLKTKLVDMNEFIDKKLIYESDSEEEDSEIEEVQEIDEEEKKK